MKNDIVLLLINVNINRVLENECKKWILVYNKKIYMIPNTIIAE